MSKVCCSASLAAIPAMLLAACVQIPENRQLANVPREPPVQQQESGDAAMSLSQLIQVEAYLNQLGYDVGVPDGRIEARTRAAIGAFEQSDGHSPTGFYSPELLAALEQKINAPSTAPAPSAPAAATTRRSTAPSAPERGGSGGSGGGSGGGGGGGGW